MILTPTSTAPTSAPEALRTLDATVAAHRQTGNRRAVFPDVYAIITRRVAERLDAGGFFQAPAFISALAGRFCTRYLETARWDAARLPQDTRAWSVAYAACDAPNVIPLQQAMLGLSAHINFDLAIGIADVVTEFGAGGDLAALRRFKHDHEAVNVLLRAAVPETLDLLATRYGCPLSRALAELAPRVAEAGVMAVLGRWRARVWDDAMALLRRPVRAAWGGVIAKLERRSAAYALAMGATTLR